VKINVIPGRDPHYTRLTQSLQALGHEVLVGEPETGVKFDMAFVSPSYDKGYNQSENILFFDAEDDHKHFDPGVAYHELKDKVIAYAKMHYVDDDRGDGIKNVAFPIIPYLTHIQAASVQIPDFSAKNAVPFMAVSPTFIGNYKGTAPRDPRFTAEFAPGDLMYNQRYQWLYSLEENNIFYQGGVVFWKDNVSFEEQRKYYGDVIKTFEVSRVENYLEKLAYCRIGLCPTGHDRLSWRVFDIMAMGSILISTDRQDQKHLYNPKAIIEIKDDEDLGMTLHKLQPDYKEIWKEHNENRKVLSQLTPDIIWKDFKEQLI